MTGRQKLLAAAALVLNRRYEEQRRLWALATGRPYPVDGGHHLRRGK